jgi:hypothetical protein
MVWVEKAHLNPNRFIDRASRNIVSLNANMDGLMTRMIILTIFLVGIGSNAAPAARPGAPATSMPPSAPASRFTRKLVECEIEYCSPSSVKPKGEPVALPAPTSPTAESKGVAMQVVPRTVLIDLLPKEPLPKLTEGTEPEVPTIEVLNIGLENYTHNLVMFRWCQSFVENATSLFARKLPATISRNQQTLGKLLNELGEKISVNPAAKTVKIAGHVLENPEDLTLLAQDIAIMKIRATHWFKELANSRSEINISEYASAIIEKIPEEFKKTEAFGEQLYLSFIKFDDALLASPDFGFHTTELPNFPDRLEPKTALPFELPIYVCKSILAEQAAGFNQMAAALIQVPLRSLLLFMRERGFRGEKKELFNTWWNSFECLAGKLP